MLSLLVLDQVSSDDMLTLERMRFSCLSIFVLEEHFFTCPYCWEQISMLLDLSADSQTYVEDCEVCCHPISISYDVSDGALVSFSAGEVQ